MKSDYLKCAAAEKIAATIVGIFLPFLREDEIIEATKDILAVVHSGLDDFEDQLEHLRNRLHPVARDR